MTDNDIKELRSWAEADRLVGLGEIARLIDALLADRVRLLAENTKLHGWTETEAQATGTLQRKLNAALEERDTLLAERDRLARGADDLRRERDQLQTALDDERAVRALIVKDRDQLRADNKRLINDLIDTESALAVWRGRTVRAEIEIRNLESTKTKKENDHGGTS